MLQQAVRGNAENNTIQDNELLNRSAAISGNKDVARAMRDTLTGENSLEVSAGNDTVTISEEARKLQRGSKTAQGETEESSLPGGKTVIDAGGIISEGAEPASSSADPVQDLRRQIQDIQKQISEAQQRLSQTSAGGTNAAKAPEASASAGAAAENAASGDAAGAEAARNGTGTSSGAGSQASAGTGQESPEAKAIQNEIDTLTMQLQTLQYQLMEMTQQSSAQGAMGTAGIGGEGDGARGGMGERISVS